MNLQAITFVQRQISINDIIGLSIALILFVLFDIIFAKIFNRKFVLLYLISAEVILMASWYFGIDLLTIVTGIALGVGLTFFLFANMNEARVFIANSMKGKASFQLFGHKKDETKPEHIFDREAMYKKIETAVVTLSKQKIGAIITFEKKDSLNDVIKSGTILNAPVVPELLLTIFYEGTRLHDGAVIIRDDKILAASVYFTPTTRPLTGKFGSRHRAAIGISEITDSVTVVVSEETGRISIAYDGELQAVAPDTFLKVFEEYMAIAKAPEDENEDSEPKPSDKPEEHK
ncbi:MAG: DNA integrity scanning protein DisA [Tenericutes bacterium ADurb.BinA155]|nr:MAG: DNA integrity scanning protein DisA [Tenericutes bacterium ADurb.BinA155]